MEKTLNNRKVSKKYYALYSIVFLLCALILVGALVLNGKTNINKIDGMSQYYRAAMYYSGYLRNIVSNIFKGKFEIPMWNHSFGEGADIISTMHGYGLGDPIAFLSVLFPQKNIYIFYYFNALIRLYLAGLFFSKLCFYKGINNKYGVLAAALTYCFGYWGLHNFTMHTYFLIPLMYMPLLILSLEIYIEEKNPFYFIFTVFFCSISFLYFFYMEALATAIYGIIRVFFKNKKQWLTSIKELFIILGYALIGVAMAAVVLVPMLQAYLGDSRLSNTGKVLLVYPRFFYERLFTIYLSNDFPYDFYMGYASATLLSIGLLLKNYKKHWILLVIFALCFISVILPFVGKVWNGFTYVSGRFSFIIALPVSYTLALMWDEFKENRKYLLFILIGVIGLSMVTPWSRTIRVFVPVGICVLFYLVSTFDLNKKIKNYDLRQLVMIGLIILNVMFNYAYALSQEGGDVLDDMLTIEKAKSLVDDNEAAIIKNNYFKENDFFRYDSNLFNDNDAVSNNVYSTNYYWSITNPNIQLSRIDLGVRDRINWQLIGYDHRAQLDTLANVRYYLHSDDNFDVIPYGFSYLENKGNYDIYENNFALDFGYSYDSTLSYDKWLKLNPLQRQEALLDYVVVDDGEDVNINLDRIMDITYTMVPGEGVELADKTITTSDYNQSIVFILDDNNNFDRYMSIEGLEFDDIYHEIEDDHTMALLTIESTDCDPQFLHHMTLVNRYYFNKHDYVTYLDHSGKDNVVKVTFSLPGTYTYEDIYFNEIDMSDYETRISKLNKNHLDNLIIDTNTVSGNISTDSQKYVLFSIPYSKGWKAYVDGSLTPLSKANGQYMMVKVDSGNHNITLKYQTPGLLAGSIISLAAFGLVIYGIIRKRRYEA